MSRRFRSIVEPRNRRSSVVLRQEFEEAEQKREIYLWIVIVSALVPVRLSTKIPSQLDSYLNAIPSTLYTADNPPEDERPGDNGCHQKE